MPKLNALRRARARPQAGGGSSALLLLNAAPVPVGPLDGIFTTSNNTYLPSSGGYTATSTGQKLFFEFTNPYSLTPAVTTITDVDVQFLDDDLNGVNLSYRVGGTQDGWLISAVNAGVNARSYPNFNNGYGKPLAAATDAILRIVYSPQATNRIAIYSGDTLVGQFSSYSSVVQTSANFTRVRYTAPNGFGRTPISGVRYGVLAQPFILTAAVPTSLFAAEIDYDYTNTNGQVAIPNIQLYYADGVTPYGAKSQAILVSNTVAGKAKVRSPLTYTSGQNSTKPVFKLFEVQNGVETGNVATGTITMPARAATFGANLVAGGPYAPLRTKADAFKEGTTQDVSNGYAFIGPGVSGKTDADGWPLSSAVQRNIGKADVSGTKMIITWEGDGTVDSGNFKAVEGDTVVGSKTVVDSNTFSYVQTFTRTGVGGNSFAGIRFNPGTTGPKNIKIFPEGEDRTKYWADSYLTFVNKSNIFSGSLRVMDGRNINGNGTIDMTWAMRTLPDALFPGVDGESIERCIELANSAGRDLYLPIPAFATDDYVTQLAIAINTGANLSQGKPWSNGLLPNLKWYAERGNEVWNTLFANYQFDRTRYASRMGETALGDGNGGTEQSFKEHAFQYNRMMNLIKAAIPNYATRVVRTFATQRGTLMYNLAMQAGYGSNIDALAMAPYFDLVAYATQINASGKTPEEIEPFMAASIDSVMSSMLQYAAMAKANGHRFICYEAGMDWANNNDSSPDSENDPTTTIPGRYKGKPWYLTGAQILAFRTSPSFYRCTYRYFNIWKSQYGDEMNQYYDIGGTGGRYQWGLKPFQGSPAPDYGVLALQDVIAGLPMRY